MDKRIKENSLQGICLKMQGELYYRSHNEATCKQRADCKEETHKKKRYYDKA